MACVTHNNRTQKMKRDGFSVDFFIWSIFLVCYAASCTLAVEAQRVRAKSKVTLRHICRWPLCSATIRMALLSITIINGFGQHTHTYILSLSLVAFVAFLLTARNGRFPRCPGTIKEVVSETQAGNRQVLETQHPSVGKL